MRIAVIGASGRTGAAFLAAARAAGHETVAVVRDPTRLSSPATSVQTADALSAAQLATAIHGVDAVAWCVGPGRDTAADVMATSIAATIEAMATTGVSRLIMISASGPFTAGDNPVTRFVAKPILWRPLGAVWRDMVAAEAVTRASTADWTIMRPPQLTNRASKGGYKSRRELNVTWGFTITRADLADAMLDALADDSTIHQAVSVAN